MLCKCKQLDSSPLESAKQSYKHCILRPAAMTPSQFDILLQRLIAMETPKDSWIFIQKQMSAYNNLPLGAGSLVRPLPSKVVVFLVILVWNLDIPKPPQEYQFLEFYAGVGRIATLAKWCGFATAAVDIRYGAHRQREGKRRPMDINGNAGLVFLVFFGASLCSLM